MGRIGEGNKGCLMRLKSLGMGNLVAKDISLLRWVWRIRLDKDSICYCVISMVIMNPRYGSGCWDAKPVLKISSGIPFEDILL